MYCSFIQDTNISLCLSNVDDDGTDDFFQLLEISGCKLTKDNTNPVSLALL
jgi:hypothetical protein